MRCRMVGGKNKNLWNSGCEDHTQEERSRIDFSLERRTRKIRRRQKGKGYARKKSHPKEEKGTEGKRLLVSKKDIKRGKHGANPSAAFCPVGIPLLTVNMERRATQEEAQKIQELSAQPTWIKRGLQFHSLRKSSREFARGCLRLKEAAKLNSDGRKSEVSSSQKTCCRRGFFYRDNSFQGTREQKS